MYWLKNNRSTRLDEYFTYRALFYVQTGMFCIFFASKNQDKFLSHLKALCGQIHLGPPKFHFIFVYLCNPCVRCRN